MPQPAAYKISTFYTFWHQIFKSLTEVLWLVERLLTLQIHSFELGQNIFELHEFYVACVKIHNFRPNTYQTIVHY